jgi:hypothetical protein
VTTASAPSASLGALSADIARAIDHDAAVELWARHNKGEKNLFTRRLYTLSGQQTFDEIRKKYQREGDFRSAVDRYVSDFEKLMSEVTKSGKDRAAGTAYLTSDTGKVYTMLAHAPGLSSQDLNGRPCGARFVLRPSANNPAVLSSSFRRKPESRFTPDHWQSVARAIAKAAPGLDPAGVVALADTLGAARKSLPPLSVSPRLQD